MSAEAVRVMNAAITRQNGNTIASADDDSKEAKLFHSNYEELVKTELIGPSWKFARKLELLTALSNAPIDEDWDYKLQKPADCLMLRSVIKDGRPIEYEIGPDDTILADENEEVYAVYTRRAPEDLWPADFREGIIRRCEAILLRADEKHAQAEDRDAAAGDKFDDARRNHAQEEYPKDVRKYPLVDARRLGYAPRRS